MLTGKRFEDRAARLLRRAGLTLIARNYRCKLGEIDLVCRDGNTLVFVEVRYRSPRGYACAAASVTPAKQRKLLAAAQHYLQTHRLSDQTPCRIDVVAIDAGQRAGEHEIQWIKNAIGS